MISALVSLAASAVHQLTGSTVGSLWSKATLILSEAADATSSATSAADATSGATAAAAAAASPFLNAIEYTIVVPQVYFSVLFCILGIVWRLVKIFRSPPPPYSLKIYPSSKSAGLGALNDTFAMPQLRRHKPLFWVFLIIFHISLILLLLGHLDILPTISIVSESSKHMIGAGLVGVGVTVPLLYFLFRRFRTPVREITVPADYLLLVLILFLFLFGDLMSWGNSWTANGFVMTKQDFSLYFQGLAQFTFADPRAVLPGSHYHFLVIHVLLADLFFIILPFSKIVHAFLSYPINLLRRK
jgi:nitrate reductase gamma subunit